MVTRKSFIDGVISEVTMDVLPMNLPPSRINKILTKAINTWRDRDDRATQEDILFIDIQGSSNLCKKIVLPEDVKAVTRLELVSINNSLIYNIEGKQTLGSYAGGYGGEEAILTYISIGAYEQLVGTLGARFVPYDFSEYTHELILEGNPSSNIFLEVARFIPEQALFKMDEFESYVAAKITIDFRKVNRFLEKKLVGNRQIDFDVLREDAQKFLDQMEEKWDSQDGDAILMLD